MWSVTTTKPHLPSTHDITQTFEDVLSCLDYTSANLDFHIEDDIPFVLSSLECPIKYLKSALNAPPPGTPHSFQVLFALHS